MAPPPLYMSGPSLGSMVSSSNNGGSSLGNTSLSSSGGGSNMASNAGSVSSSSSSSLLSLNSNSNNNANSPLQKHGHSHSNSNSNSNSNYNLNPSTKNRNRRPSQREKKAAARGSGSGSGSGLSIQFDLVPSPSQSQSSPLTPAAAKRGEISLTHLMNFSFPPRESSASTSTPIRRKKSSLYVPFNKEKFINANYRFVLKPAPYKSHLINPDIPLPWSQILQVIIPHPINNHPTCPICLNPPTAPRVTRCGHVFCYPCMLRYLESGNPGNEYGTCPVCLEYVYSKDVRPVSFLGTLEWSKDVAGTMVLMKRGLTSTIALPSTTWTPSLDSPPPQTSFYQPYSHLLLASLETHSLHLHQDRASLSALLKDLIQEERTYRATGGQLYLDLATQSAAERRAVEKAVDGCLREVEACAGAIWEVLEEEEGVHVPGYVPASMKDPGGGQRSGRKGSKNRGVSRGAGVGERRDSPERSGEEDGRKGGGGARGRGQDVSPDRTPKASRTGGGGQKNVNSRTGQPSAEYFYFYQAQDGQHMYLHPLDIKVLKHEFKEYDLFPEVITGKVLHVQESTMTEDLRKKCRYMSHLPLSCDVNFCELDLSALVSPETLSVFEKELKHRAEEHRRKYEAESKKSSKGKGTLSVPTGGGGSSVASSSRSSSPIPDWAKAMPPEHYQQLQERRIHGDEEISSSWEDPSLFDALFPAAIPATSVSPTTPSSNSSISTTPSSAMHHQHQNHHQQQQHHHHQNQYHEEFVSLQQSVAMTASATTANNNNSSAAWGGNKRVSSISSFASAAAKGSSVKNTSGILPQQRGSRFATLKNHNRGSGGGSGGGGGSSSDDDETTREYRYVEEAWAVELEESLVLESAEREAAGLIDDTVLVAAASSAASKKKKKNKVLLTHERSSEKMPTSARAATDKEKDKDKERTDEGSGSLGASLVGAVTGYSSGQGSHQGQGQGQGQGTLSQAHSVSIRHTPVHSQPMSPEGTTTHTTTTERNNHQTTFTADEDFGPSDELNLDAEIDNAENGLGGAGADLEADIDIDIDAEPESVVVVAADDGDAGDEEAVEEADRLLCGEGPENATVKELQDAINVSRPFGLKLWKPALYKKDRSINVLTDLAIHDDPDDPSQKPIWRFFNPGNLSWLLIFGWAVSLVYLSLALFLSSFFLVGFLGLHSLSIASGFFGYRRISTGQIRRQVEAMVFSRDENTLFRVLAVAFYEMERAKEYVLLLLNFSWYMFWPFGKFVIKKRRSTRYFITVPTTTPAPSSSASQQDTLETTHLLSNQATGGGSSSALNIHSDVESEYETASIIWNDEDTESEDDDDDDDDFDDDDEDDGDEMRSDLSVAADSGTTETPNRQLRRRLRRQQRLSQPRTWTVWARQTGTKLREAGFAGILFRALAFIVLGPVHLFISIVCFLGVFSLPMGRLNFAVLSRLTRRRALAVRACWGESRKAFGIAGTGVSAVGTTVTGLAAATGSGSVARAMTPGVQFQTDGGSFLQQSQIQQQQTAPPQKTKREYKIILCTNHAFGLRYYKYTLDGINIIILNLNAVVVFTLANFYYIGPLTNHTGIGSYGVTFLAALFSVVPLAYMIGMAVSSITAQTGSLALGAVVNATFGSIVEILLYCLALMQGKTKMVEGSIIGSFMAGLLALPGVSMFFGGLTRKEQKFNARAAGVTSTLLIMAILGAFGPTFFQGVYGTFELQCVDCPKTDDGQSPTLKALHCHQCRYSQPHPTEDPIYIGHTRPLMYICATVLILMYAIGLLFTLRTHSKNIYPTEPKKRKYRYLRSEQLYPIDPPPPTTPLLGSIVLPSPELQTINIGSSTLFVPNTARSHITSRSPRESVRRAKTLPTAINPGLGIQHTSPLFSPTVTGSSTSGLPPHGVPLPPSQQQLLSKRIARTSAAQFNNGSIIEDPWSSVRAQQRMSSSSSTEETGSSSSGEASSDDEDGGRVNPAMMDSMISVGSSVAATRGVPRKKTVGPNVKGKGKAVAGVQRGRYYSSVSAADGNAGEYGASGGFTASATPAASIKAKKKESGGGHGGHDNPNWSASKSAIVLLLATLFFSMIAEVLIDCVDNVIDTGEGYALKYAGQKGADGKWVVDEKILGLTLFALVPTVTEFYNAIAFARQGNIALSLEIGSAYTIQVALLQIPTLVAFSTFWRHYGTVPPPPPAADVLVSTQASKVPFWMIGRIYDAYVKGPNALGALNAPSPKDTFTLVFPKWDVISVLFGVFAVTYLYIEGKSNYFKGAMLLFAYGILM
ncbi:hypothetical protein HDU79_010598, partial [Rhizoclosmatium sp. JEL0117]